MLRTSDRVDCQSESVSSATPVMSPVKKELASDGYATSVVSGVTATSAARPDSGGGGGTARAATRCSPSVAMRAGVSTAAKKTAGDGGGGLAEAAASRADCGAAAVRDRVGGGAAFEGEPLC